MLTNTGLTFDSDWPQSIGTFAGAAAGVPCRDNADMNFSRRHLVHQGAALAAGALLLPRLGHAQAAWPQRAFDARSTADALKALGATSLAASAEVVLEAPELSEDGSLVPLALSSRLEGVRQLALLVERNPGLLTAVFNLSDAVEPQVSVRVKMQESSRVIGAALLADGRALQVARGLRVTAGGCAGAADPDAVTAPASVPIKLRAQATPGKGTVVRALLTHEMESGQRRDAQGRPIAAWHITDFHVRLNGQPVLSAWWGPAVARNPFVQFTLKSARAGDKLAIGWIDNRGNRRTDEAVVS